MLNSFRNASHSIFIKILFGAIIFSFCLWGVGDIIRGYSASRSVFSVGKLNFTAENFMKEYNKGRQNIKNNAKVPLSEEELKKIDVRGMVLNKLVHDAVLEQTLSRLNIIVPKRSIMNVIQSLPDFQTNGVFDDGLYATAIRRAGIDEAGFLHQIHENLAKTQLLHPIIAGYKIPNIIKENIAAEFVEKKKLLIGKIKLREVKLDKEPTVVEIKQYFSANADKYKKPETRSAAILVVDYSGLAKDTKVSKEEVDEYYKTNKDSFATNEMRDFERFVFDNKEDADKAWTMINKGHKTKEVIKKLKPEVGNIKGIIKSALPGKVGHELFDLKLDQTSNVYEIDGKYHIYKLVKINSSKKKNEEEIKKEIEKLLQSEKMNSPEFYGKIKEMKNKIDDGFGSGKSIDVIAKETGMRIVELKSVQKAGDNAELIKLIPHEETRRDVQSALFSTGELEASQTIDSKESDTISYVVYTRKIEKSIVPQLDAIMQKVKDDLISEKEDKKAIEKVNLILGRGKEAAAEVAKLNGVHEYKVSKKDVLLHQKVPSKEVERISKEIPNLNAVLDVMSNLKKGEAVNYKLPSGDYVLIAVQNSSENSDATHEFEEMISKYVDSGAGNDIDLISMSAFKSQLKIKIDDKLLKEITTTVDEQEINN